jgi:hypothetical protein
MTSTRKKLLSREKIPEIEICACILLARAFTVNERLERYKTMLAASYDCCDEQDLRIDEQQQADYDASPFLFEKDRAIHALAAALASWRAAGRPDTGADIPLPGRAPAAVSSLAQAVCDFHYAIINAWGRRRIREGQGKG